jgi:hypothetical protein
MEKKAIKAPDGFDRIRALRSFPKELLHPSIAKDAWAALQREDWPADGHGRYPFTLGLRHVLVGSPLTRREGPEDLSSDRPVRSCALAPGPCQASTMRSAIILS